MFFLNSEIIFLDFVEIRLVNLAACNNNNLKHGETTSRNENTAFFLSDLPKPYRIDSILWDETWSSYELWELIARRIVHAASQY